MKTILKKIIFGTLTFTSLSSCGQSAKKIEQMEEKAKTLTGLATATFGTGCFWCTEAVYQEMEGVESVVSGYSGGFVENPTYEQVCEKTTGHAECVQLKYDPKKVTYLELLEVFFKVHDPTTKDRQGNDVGPQYRSVIFYHDAEQKALAEKAILPVLPSPSDFPYAIRITSEVTGSNGSSSMASVCGATLALLDAGVPLKAPVAGLSIGLAKRKGDDEKYQLMVDITGTEDHYGAMDFKIAGTHDMVTAVHLDVHEPLPHGIVFDALRLAKDSRRVLLEKMETDASKSSGRSIKNLRPRAELKPSAPRVEVVRFDPMRKKDLLGPGGAVIRQMEDRFNVSLDLTQEGQCLLFGEDREMVRKARVAVMDLVSDVEVGEVYEGTVIEIRDFGVIVELLRNKEGLCHVSEMAGRDKIRSHPKGPMGLINSLVKVGQKIDVECTAVDPVMGTIRVRPAKKSCL